MSLKQDSQFVGIVPWSHNRFVSQMRAPLAACREPAGEPWQLCRALYVFEHKTQYLLIHAPFTRIVVFWHISNVPFVNIAIQPAAGCYNSWANLRCSSCSPLGEKSLWNGTITWIGDNFVWSMESFAIDRDDWFSSDIFVVFIVNYGMERNISGNLIQIWYLHWDKSIQNAVRHISSLLL